MNKLMAVYQYELRRTASAGRIIWWIALASFPVLITLLLQWLWTSIESRPGGPADNPQVIIESSDAEGGFEQSPGSFSSADSPANRSDRGRKGWGGRDRRFDPQEDSGRRRPRPRRSAPEMSQRPTIWSIIYFITTPCVCCAMSVLLTAAPAVASELEQKSWSYVASRPQGILWLMLGKFLAAATWGITTSITGVSVALLIAETDMKSQIWTTIVMLSILSAFAYSAIYLFLGTLLFRRAMVLCVMYTAIAEIMIGAFPAVINRLTVQFRLRALAVQWAPLADDFRENDEVSWYFGEATSLEHIMWLGIMTGTLLLAAIQLARYREFTAAVESDL